MDRLGKGLQLTGKAYYSHNRNVTTIIRSMRKFYPIALLTLIILFSSCADKTICPAFQSYYLLDEDKRDDMFSYFGEDSLPKQKEGIVSKNMFGIIEKPNYLTVANVSIPKNEYRARDADMQTIPMEVVYPGDEEDSLNLTGVVPDSSQATNQYESDVNFDLPDYGNLFDSAATEKDTAKVKPDYHYNIDQLYYMEIIGDEIMEGRQAKQDSLKAQQEEMKNQNPGGAEPEVKQSFFKRLFGKKKNKGTESELTDGPPLGEGDEADGDAEPAEEKKKLFGKKDKEPKEKQEKPPKEKKEKEPKEKKKLFGKDKSEESDPGGGE